MTEVPPAPQIADYRAEELYFFSIHTNDLTRYAFATTDEVVDDLRRRVIAHWQETPAVLR